MAFSRRSFLKGMAATGAGVAIAGQVPGSQYIYPDHQALAAITAPEEVKYTHCVMCNHGPKCGMKLILKEGKVFRVEQREDYPNNILCAKGIASLQELYNPERLLYPMKRTTPKGSKNPGWVRITWDEAIETIATKLNQVKRDHGADKVLFMTGDPKEPRPVLQRLAYTFGSPNYGTESSTCAVATQVCSNLLIGSSSIAMGSSPTPGKTSVAIIWGNNPAVSAPHNYASFRKGKAGGTKYIFVDPRVTTSVQQMADIHLQLRPGTDAALAYCFGNYLIANDAYDQDFVEKWVHGFEEYKEYAKEFTIEKTAEICQLPIDRLTEACELLANRNGPIIVKGSAAAPHHTNAVNDYIVRLMLLPLTGSLDVPGGALISTGGLNASYAGFTRTGDLLPKLDHMRVDREYFPVWAEVVTDQIQLNNIPEYVKEGQLKACLMLGGNAIMWPQSNEYQQAFQDMEFVAAADFYIRPWTHNYADMVLPAAISWERSAPLTTSGNNIFLREAAVEARGEARPDYRICCDIGTALGFEEEFWGGGPDSEINCLKEMLRDINVGVTYEDLQKAAPGPVNVSIKSEKSSKKYELGLLRPDGQPGFPTPTGKVEFTSEILRKHGYGPLPIFVEPVYSPVSTPDLYKEFPLIMNTGNRVPMYAHSKHRNLPWMRSLMPEPVIKLCKQDADDRRLVAGDMVKITSPINKKGIVAKLEITNILKPGVMDMFHGWEEANINLLVSRDFDKISGFPPFKEGLCQVEKA